MTANSSDFCHLPSHANSIISLRDRFGLLDRLNVVFEAGRKNYLGTLSVRDLGFVMFSLVWLGLQLG